MVPAGKGSAGHYLPELLELAREYLEPLGWFESLRQCRAVDTHGPLPWITYPAIELLKRIDMRQRRVFEYGAGASSLWWAGRGAEVVSVDCDPDWLRFAPVSSSLLPGNTVHVFEKDAPAPPIVTEWIEKEFFCRGLDPEPDCETMPKWCVACRPYLAYAASILMYPEKHFDVVVIDGAARVLCAWLAPRALSDEGIIVFDNADRVVYSKAYGWLASQGFARLDFWGPSPQNRYESCTSVFTKSVGLFMLGRRADVAPRPEHYWR